MTQGDAADDDSVLVDGDYDVMVVYAEHLRAEVSGRDWPDGGDQPTVAGVGLELVVTAGPYKGQMLELRSAELNVDPLELLGLPGTVTIAQGTPRFGLS